MTAQIRPNRMEVSDRFPMLGFAVRTDEPNLDAEVVLASDIELFSPKNRDRRTAANFYSSSENGYLNVPRGEGVFVVPSDVLARFIGNEKIYFGLATGRAANGGLTVDALPREGSPYVSLRGFTGRTLRRSFGGERNAAAAPKLDWAGDAARPGLEPSGGQASPAPVAPSPVPQPTGPVPYDDGFGPLPAIPARESGVRTLDRPAVALTLGSGVTARSVLDDLRRTVERGVGAVASEVSPPNLCYLGDSSAIFIQAWRIGLGATALFSPVSAFLAQLPELARETGVTLSVGPGLDTPVFGAGVGVVFDPGGQVALFGTAEISVDFDSLVEFVSSLKAALQLKLKLGYNNGGLAGFASLGKVASVAAGEEIVLGAEVWLDSAGRGLGGAVSVGVGAAIQFSAEGAKEAIVAPAVPSGARERAQRIGGGFAPRIGDALDLGLDENSLRPLLDTLDPPPAARPMATARPLGTTSWSINWDDVQLIPQPTGKSCWATTLAMLIGWRDQVSVNPETIAAQCGRSTTDGLPWAERSAVAAALGLQAIPPQCYTPEGFAGLIENNGPLYVGKIMSDRISSGHAVLVVGMYSDGSDHFVRIADPWDRPAGTPGAPDPYSATHASGSRYIMRYETFQAEYEMAAAGQPAFVQIIAAGVPAGRSINRSTSAPTGYAMGETGDTLPAPPPPRARAMTGGAAEAAIAIGGILIESVRDNSGDISWDLDQFRGIKHPNDSAPANPAPFQDGPTVRLDQWPSTGPIFDSINAWFAIDWQYNGRSLGNVRITNIGTNDAIGASLSVRAQIMDDNRLYPPSDCAALRVTFHYRFSRPIGSDHIAITVVHLYGDGTHESESRWVQADMLSLPEAGAMQGGGGSATAGVVTELVGLIAGEIISSSDTDISYALDRFEGWKRPEGVAADAPFGRKRRSKKTIEWDDGGILDAIGMKIDIEWHHDGTSLGEVHMTPYGFNDARGDSLVVTGQILNDYDPYYGMAPLTSPEQLQAYQRQPGARLRVRLHYRKSRLVRSDQTYVIEVTLLPDGNSYSEGKWMDNDVF